MPIEALPQNTVRAIGSTSVISDPYSVVKELVDNAIDASATSLQIEISQNTVDVIQVKDNGHGISPEDQQYVCKRAFTSKIRTLDDLKNVGGSSLGFRGEALASVAEMSGVLAITTRVESEVAGLCLKYGRNGELNGTSRTSHPVGTTVRVTDFLKHIPVRRQTALKSATRTLTRIKKLVQAYAIAQPSNRISLKVLKAKNENHNWSYAPSTDPSLSDAAMKVAGIDVSSSCVLKQFYSQGEAESSQASNTTYEAVAFLPRSEFDASKINNVGQYISVDGRPLSSNRGIGQEIVKLFKPYVRLAASKNETPKPVTDPFLCLQIRCPRGTYDVNIEPAKDDLLFADRKLVLTLVENLFRDHYGELDATENGVNKQNKETISGRDDASAGFGLLMARRPTVNPATGPRDCANPSDEPHSHTPLPQGQIPPSQGFATEPSSDIIPESSDQSATATTKRSSFINPWSISKINASFQTPRRERIPLNLTSPLNLPSGSPPGLRRGSDSRSLQSTPNLLELTSPPTSQFASGSPVQRRRHLPQLLTVSSPGANRMSSSRRAERERDRDRYGNGALDTWFQWTTQASLQQTPLEETTTQEPSDTPLSVLAQQRFEASGNTSPNKGYVNGQDDGSDGSSADEASQSPRQGSPRREHQVDHLPESMDSGRGFPVLERWAAQLHEGLDPGEPSDLERALDFERRKKEAIRSRLRLNQDIRPSESQTVPGSPSPHRSRYLAAKAALTSSQTSIAEPVSATTYDPRSNLIRQHRDHSADKAPTDDGKARKIPTNRLPLERIPDGFELYNLGITCPIDLSIGSNVFKRNTLEDLYTVDNNEAPALSTSDLEACLPFWEERLTLIMKQRYKSRDESKPMSLNLDVASAISRHLRNIDTNGN
ncbi:DNA mismatch repair protein C-terminal [Penicillium sp. DV-2018c]|nr:DNA mismatch repair protein C-terminal [Penicillium sp. DV-2018c]